MTEKKQELRLLVPAALMLMIALAAMTGIPLLIEALILLPVASALLTYYCGWIGAAGVCAAGAVACGFVLPGAALPTAFVWCAGSLLAGCVPVKKPLMRPVPGDLVYRADHAGPADGRADLDQLGQDAVRHDRRKSRTGFDSD